jgi:uncharacterized membrane protein (DUF106 family)
MVSSVFLLFGAVVAAVAVFMLAFYMLAYFMSNIYDFLIIVILIAIIVGIWSKINNKEEVKSHVIEYKF